MTGTAGARVQANTNRVEGRVPMVPNTVSTRAGSLAKLPVRRTVVVCRSQAAPSWSPTSYGNTFTAEPLSSSAETARDGPLNRHVRKAASFPEGRVRDDEGKHIGLSH